MDMIGIVLTFLGKPLEWILSFRRRRMEQERQRLWYYMSHKQIQAQKNYKDNVCVTFSESTLSLNLKMNPNRVEEFLFELMAQDMVEMSDKVLFSYSVSRRLRPRPGYRDFAFPIVVFPESPYVEIELRSSSAGVQSQVV